MTDPETIAIYDAKAEEYATSFCGGLEPDAQLIAFMNRLPNTADVLDLGCGPGRSAAIMALAGHTVLATDASAEMVRLANEHQGVTARQATFDDITQVDAFDGIWANFSLLHAERVDLPRYITALVTALRAGGVFHIGMKTGEDMARDRLGRRYTYVSESELTNLLTQAGLTLAETWTGADKGLSGTVDPWIVLQAIKHG